MSTIIQNLLKPSVLQQRIRDRRTFSQTHILTEREPTIHPDKDISVLVSGSIVWNRYAVNVMVKVEYRPTQRFIALVAEEHDGDVAWFTRGRESYGSYPKEKQPKWVAYLLDEMLPADVLEAATLLSSSMLYWVFDSGFAVALTKGVR